MTRLGLAVKVIVEELKEELEEYEHGDFRADVDFILCEYSNDNKVDLYLNDYYELELEDGSFVSYKQLMNAVRKELRKEEIL